MKLTKRKLLYWRRKALIIQENSFLWVTKEERETMEELVSYVLVLTQSLIDIELMKIDEKEKEREKEKEK